MVPPWFLPAPDLLLMDYENRPVPEGINVSKVHPLVDFIWLVVTVGLIIVIAIVALSLSAGWLAKQIPFQQEAELVKSLNMDHGFKTQSPQVQQWLQQLANKLGEAEGLPKNMSVTVHYINKPVVNAFATLGGNLVVYSGLMKNLHTQNAVAFVLAHEIGHIKHRDPIMALGRGTATALALSLIFSGNSRMTQNIAGNVGLLTELTFTRDQERAADKAAINTLLAYYGYLNGSLELFREMAKTHPHQVPVIFRTHPLTTERLARLTRAQTTHPQGKPVPFSLTALKTKASEP